MLIDQETLQVWYPETWLGLPKGRIRASHPVSSYKLVQNQEDTDGKEGKGSCNVATVYTVNLPSSLSQTGPLTFITIMVYYEKKIPQTFGNVRYWLRVYVIFWEPNFPGPLVKMGFCFSSDKWDFGTSLIQSGPDNYGDPFCDYFPSLFMYNWNRYN